MSQLKLGVILRARLENERQIPIHPAHFERIPESVWDNLYFENGYGDSPLAAGLRLAIIPIAIGVVAPISGLLFDRFGSRLPTLTGMLTCAASLVLLYFALDGTRADLLGVMIALGIFGVGQGLFTAANNTAIMAAAPEDLSGEAGGLLNHALEQARERARRMASAAPTASHVLLALLSQRDSAAHRVLKRCGVDLGKLRVAAMNAAELGLIARRRVAERTWESPQPVRAAAPQRRGLCHHGASGSGLHCCADAVPVGSAYSG